MGPRPDGQALAVQSRRCHAAHDAAARAVSPHCDTPRPRRNARAASSVTTNMPHCSRGRPEPGFLSTTQTSASGASAEDGKIWARWVAVSLQQHQSRFLCSNSFQSDLEPAPGAVCVLAFDKLVEMLGGRVQRPGYQGHLEAYQRGGLGGEQRLHQGGLPQEISGVHGALSWWSQGLLG
eukprot:3835895-Amphidinium_carterae.1